MTGGGLGRVHTERVVLFDRDDPLACVCDRRTTPLKARRSR
jgi:hypothetical protein